MPAAKYHTDALFVPSNTEFLYTYIPGLDTLYYDLCLQHGLNTEDAMVRSRWRKQIGMIDDHDECEWVNVSSGTGSPGLSRTNSTEP